MLKKQLAVSRLPKLASNDTSLSSKLYSLTGLRIFQAKFMEDLKSSKNQNKLPNYPCGNLQNMGQTMPSLEANKQGPFVGKDKSNELRLNDSKQIKIKEEKTKQPILREIKLKTVVIYKNSRPRGLKNLGNTCYMNAILQSMFTFQQFNRMLQKQYTSKTKEANITLSYLKLYRKYKASLETDVISPHQFKSVLGRQNSRFQGKSQQDSQQFLTSLLENLNNQMSRVQNKPKYQELSGDTSKEPVKTIAQNWWNYFKLRDNSQVCDYFQGQSETTIFCSSCKFKTVSFDNFWGMPVSLGRQTSSLIDVLSHSYGIQNHLEGYCCQKCKKENHCSKKTKIFRFPKILVIQLKRFGYGSSKKQKIKQKVDVSVDLNLDLLLSQDSTEQKCTYYLKSTVQHSGQLNFGHYTGHVFSQKEQKWYLANDEQIKPQYLQKDSPQLYVLFYHKK